ncbi:DUF4188 domain-containing protein [Micromonospora fiedleri]|uniref:DUF4188 domain-containing protein n=1 Tax=Micromonospora fiedleri TaxID=1157498 RepID=A0ABS1UVM3_9ACTN|nr:MULTISPECIES: DUF4188 domain-containing protein [Micromonospora]MBL6279698.1 DUF4188 domain-containing protein [Micromonospora fiedleri]WSK40915.1 DUF4188 domain-containing protein [Micromonospora maris]
MRTRDFSRAPAQARAGAMFIGATRYSNPLVLLRLAPAWFRMVRDMRRMSGYCWHTVYWQFPLTLGTIAFFTDRDAMLRFARTRQHRRLMVWLTDGTRNATAGFIRLYTAAPDGYSNGTWRAEGPEMGHIATFTPIGAETTGPEVVR